MSSDYGTPIDFMDSISGAEHHLHHDDEHDAIAYAQETPPGVARPPVHHLITEQARSLHELQHEVRTLLEFRDLVIDAFPNLRAKLSTTTRTAAATPAAAWLPGVRVRRRKESTAAATATPKRANDAAAVQDSGFSTETSCKDTHSTGSSGGATAARAPSPASDDDDELCNLLDAIFRKGTALKDELDAMRGVDFAGALDVAPAARLRELRDERDRLLDRLAEARADADAQRVRAERVEETLRRVERSKRDLEYQVGKLASQRGEVNARIHDLHVQFVAKSPERAHAPGCDTTEVCDSEGATPTVETLDALLLAGGELPKARAVDARKVAAILREFDPLVLQKHLLTSAVRNDILMEQIESATKLEVGLIDELDKAREDNRTLKFQLEDKEIELEGTRAQVRILEQNRMCNSPDVIPTTLNSSELTSMQQLTPLIDTSKRKVHLQDGSSSTESAHQDNPEEKVGEDAIGKRRPSKIPLKSTPPKGKATTPVPSTPRGRDSPGRPHSAQSWKNRSTSKSIESVKSNGSSMVTSKDSLSSKLRYSESMSKMSISSQFGRNSALRKSSLTNGSGHRGQPPQTPDNGQKNVSKPKRDWVSPAAKSSLAKEPLPFPDSLDGEISWNDRLNRDDSDVHSYQTAKNFLWNMESAGKSKEFYDSIDSSAAAGFSIYRNGEEMADCDSLEKREISELFAK